MSQAPESETVISEPTKLMFTSNKQITLHA